MSWATGQVNAYFRWKTLSDVGDKLEMALFLLTPADLKTTFELPRQATADVSLRRIQGGSLPPGGAFDWRFGDAQGEGKADASGLISIPALTITADAKTLTVIKKRVLTK